MRISFGGTSSIVELPPINAYASILFSHVSGYGTILPSGRSEHAFHCGGQYPIAINATLALDISIL
jgi:hypothetical protein